MESQPTYQLDIFADSASVQRTNDLIAALANFDREASRQAIQRLAAVDPNHAGIAHFRVLCDFVEHWVDSRTDPDWPRSLSAVAAEERLLREQIIPAAAMMGNAGNKLFQKCWSTLAAASEKANIGPEHSDYFAAEFYLRGQQFKDVVRTASIIPGAEMRAPALRWMGLGYYGCGEPALAQRAVLRYAWLAPRQFNAFISETHDKELERDWNAFQADLDDLDATWFPAWCAHEKKTGSTLLDNIPITDGGMAYRLVTNLALRERGGLCSAVYEDRSRLKKLNACFFAFYMKRREDMLARFL
jgi:hypothetical protein